MKPILLFFILLLIPIALAQPINPKALDEVTLKITQSGTLVTTGFDRANMTVYIPQEGIENIAVETDGGTWNYIYDSFGNRIILIEWGKTNDVVKYGVVTWIKNIAKKTYNDKPIGNNDVFLKETDSVILSDDIKKAAYPYEKSLKKAAELTTWVHKHMTYDLTYSGMNLPSDTIFEEKRGVCAEYATLLTSLLRASGIPTRYVVGYAYSNVQNEFEGHAWVEVLASDGTWVPFDATWLQGGYLDATHIKTGNLLDNNQTETLSYMGGKIIWQKTPDSFELLNYKEKDVLNITATSPQILPANANGYVLTKLKTQGCGLFDFIVSSCVDRHRQKMLNIYDANRSVWFCDNEDVYWFFSQNDGVNKFYSCPVVVYDQTGASSTTRTEFRDEGTVSETFISGPETVNTNENFRLTGFVTDNFIFYSPELGRHDQSTWDLNLNEQGTYHFYLYYDGALAIKNVTAVERKEFDIKLQSPLNASLKDSFIVNVSVKNLLGGKIVAVQLDFDSYRMNETVSFLKGEEKAFLFNLTATKSGNRKISFSVFSDTLSTYSTSIYIYEIRSWWQNITDPIAKFFDAIVKFFSNILR